MRLLPLLLVFAGVLGACASQRHVVPVVETRPVAGFSSLIVRGPVDVNVSIEPSHSVRIACDERLVPQIRTRIEGTTLVVESGRSEGWHFHIFSTDEPDEPCAVNVALPELVEVSVYGSGDVAVHGEVANLQRVMTRTSGNVTFDLVRTARLELSTSGSGDVELRSLKASEVLANLSGSGDLRASGTTNAITVHARGSGGVDVAKLEAAVCSVQSSGSADISIFASRRIELEASGSGDVIVHGRPAEKQIEIHGSGSLRWD